MARVAVKKLRYSHLTCRSFGHLWHEVDPDDWGPLKLRKPMFGWLRVTECGMCGTLRRELINTKGEVGSRSYRYPDGYSIKQNRANPLTKTEFRNEWMKRRGIKTRKYE